MKNSHLLVAVFHLYRKQANCLACVVRERPEPYASSGEHGEARPESQASAEVRGEGESSPTTPKSSKFVSFRLTEPVICFDMHPSTPTHHDIRAPKFN